MSENNPVPRVGQWLWSTCAAWYYGEIIGVGADANGQPTIDIRVEHPNDLIWCDSVELGEVAGPDDWENPLTCLELPEGVKPILRHVLYRMKGNTRTLFGYENHETIECNTPGDGCYRCTKYFWIHDMAPDLLAPDAAKVNCPREGCPLLRSAVMRCADANCPPYPDAAKGKL